MKRLILASQSPRRKKILKDAGFIFEILPADIDEEKYENLTPVEMVKTLSKLKAKKIADLNPNAIVIGADTTVDLNGKILSKPRDLAHARQMLNELSGSTHQVITAYTIIYNGQSQTHHETTQVIFNKLTSQQIEDYINSVNVVEFAGSYSIQEKADVFIKEVNGDLNNVVGMPTSAINNLKQILE